MCIKRSIWANRAICSSAGIIEAWSWQRHKRSEGINNARGGSKCLVIGGLGLGIIVRSLGFGLLTGAFTPGTRFVDWDWRSSGKAFGLPLFEEEHFLKELKVVEHLKTFAADHGRSVAQLALAWVLGHPAVTVGLVGMRNENELIENVAAADWWLTQDERQEIDAFFEAEGVPTYVDAQQAS